MDDREALQELYYRHGWSSLEQFDAACPSDLVCFDDPCSSPGPLRRAFFEHVLGLVGEREPLDYFEFGVHRGRSLGRWMRGLAHPSSRLFAFDTFTGLPETWVGSPRGADEDPEQLVYIYDRNHFGTEGKNPEQLGLLPADPRVRYLEGVVQDTLLPFLAQWSDQTPTRARPKVINIDTDLYSACMFILSQLHRVLRPGDLLLFDEFRDRQHEFRAYNDYIRSHYMKDRLRCVCRSRYQYAFEVGP